MLANQGRQAQHIDYIVEASDLYTLIKSKLQEKFQEYWDSEKDSTFLGKIKPIIGDLSWCRHPKRAIDVAYTRMRLNKVGLNKYLYTIGASNTRFCQKCQNYAVEDVNHYLLTCPYYQAARNTMFHNLRIIGINNITSDILLGASEEEPHLKKEITSELTKFLITSRRLEILRAV